MLKSGVIQVHGVPVSQQDTLWQAKCSKGEKLLRICAKCIDSDHPEHAQSIIQTFVFHNSVVSMILLVDREGPDKTA